MEFEKIKTLVTATSALVNAGNIYLKLNFSDKLSESEVNDFLEPIHNDFMNVKQGLDDIKIENIKIELKTRIEMLKAPKFLKDNKKVFIEIENHISYVINLYNGICNLCVGVFNEALKMKQLNFHFKIEELGEIPQKLVDYLFHFKEDKEINELHQNLINLVKNKVSTDGLDWIEANKLEKKIDEVVFDTCNRVKAIDISIESPIVEFIKKYFNNETTNIQLTEYQIMLQGQVRSFLEYRNFVFNEIKENAKSIESYYEKHKPKK